MAGERQVDPADELPGGWTARRPTADDHGRVQEALGSWWGDLGGAAGRTQRALLVPRLFLQHFGNTSTIVEDAEGRLTAFLIGFLSQARPDVAYVHFVGVDPELQRSGMGRLLYRWFFAVATARGAREVRCVTSPENVASRAFHARMGFLIEPGDRDVDGVPVQLDYDGPGLDRVSFVRPLG
jgi:ribosomal protein S18 acetylase RimI-like enzyme